MAADLAQTAAWRELWTLLLLDEDEEALKRQAPPQDGAGSGGCETPEPRRLSSAREEGTGAYG